MGLFTNFKTNLKAKATKLNQSLFDDPPEEKVEEVYYLSNREAKIEEVEYASRPEPEHPSDDLTTTIKPFELIFPRKKESKLNALLDEKK